MNTHNHFQIKPITPAEKSPNISRRAIASLLAAVSLLSLLLTACTTTSTTQTTQQQQPKTQTSTPSQSQATLPPLPTVTPNTGWKIAFQMTKDATNLRKGESQHLPPSQVPPGTSFLVRAFCVGDGSINVTLEGKSDSSTSHTSVSTTCTLSDDLASSASSSSSGNTIEQATLNITITGPVKWTVIIEEPA
ncbi:MAG: hypothetical protein J2P37_33840 [Ktedonobacteraceae bacterium]|nr:hypothetical protein [Ktedonobacteraceae bacterium]